MGNRRREAVGVRRLAGAFDGNLPTPTTSTPLSLASWAIEGAKRLECAGLPALSTVNHLPYLDARRRTAISTLRTSLYAKKIMKKIVARWKIPLSGLLIYIGAAYIRGLARAQMRPSCIIEKMMKTIGNAADQQFQPSPTNERRWTPKNHSAPAHPGPWIPQPRQSLSRSSTGQKAQTPSPNFAKLRLWAPMGAIKRSPSGGSLLPHVRLGRQSIAEA